MIFGQIDELKYYKGISKKLDKAIECILEGNYRNGVEGKNEIEGDEVFFNIQNIETKKLEDCFFESHKKYIDIHLVIEGEEGIGYSLKSELKEKTKYDEEKDFQVLEGENKHTFRMTKDTFIIFFPEEPHMPLMALKEPQKLKKAVFKIKD